MKKIKLCYFRSFSLIILIIIINSCNYRNNNQQTEDNYNKEVEKTIIRLESENNSCKIQNQQVYIGTDSMIKTELRQLVLTKKIFLYISRNTCSPCIEETVEIIKEVFPDYIKNEKIIFMSPDYPARFRNNFYGKKLLTLESGKLGMPIEKNEAPPFFVIINSNMKIESIHIVNKMHYEYTRDYLKNVSHTLKSS
jgi:hypothetical protein